MKIPDHKPDVVHDVLKFCYTGGTPSITSQILMSAFGIYKLADYILIPELKLIAVHHIREYFIILASDGEDKRCGTSRCCEVWMNFCENALGKIYTDTNAGGEHALLKKTVVEGCRSCLEGIYSGGIEKGHQGGSGLFGGYF